MSTLRTIIFCLLGLIPAGQVMASDDPLQTFANCAGRMSAMMEHQWLMSDPRSDQTKAQRAAMLSLVEAIMMPDQGHQVLGWRIDAKQAHAVLLTRATFNSDPADADWAASRADEHIATCTGMLLS